MPTFPQIIRSATLLLALPLLLAACSGDEVHGTPSPPADFGPMDTVFFGCPSMQGLYAWPPVAGEHTGGTHNRERPWPGMTPVPISGSRMQVWALESGQTLTLLSRDTPADGNAAPTSRRGWGYSEHWGLACDDDMLDGDEEEAGSGREYGCTGLRRSFRLARMADGALAIGIRRTYYGCTDSVLGWGDARWGSKDIPDRVYWQWSKLRRIGDGVLPAGAAGG